MAMTQCRVKAGVKRLGNRARDAKTKEPKLKRLHDRVAFAPQDPNKLTYEQRRRGARSDHDYQAQTQQQRQRVHVLLSNSIRLALYWQCLFLVYA